MHNQCISGQYIFLYDLNLKVSRVFMHILVHMYLDLTEYDFFYTKDICLYIIHCRRLVPSFSQKYVLLLQYDLYNITAWRRRKLYE